MEIEPPKPDRCEILRERDRDSGYVYEYRCPNKAVRFLRTRMLPNGLWVCATCAYWEKD
jgi:hypothetical protein